MEHFKKTIGDSKKLWFEISEQDLHRFLVYAKELGCTWLNGDEIDPDHQICSCHMSIHADLKIASVPYFTWFSDDFSSVKKLLFSEFLQGKECYPKSKFIGETLFK